MASTFDASRKSVQPPPTTIPSSTAALVAFSASSTLSFFSLSSVSVCAPTYITTTPPESLAILSFSFSFSYSYLNLVLDLCHPFVYFVLGSTIPNYCC
ncbi:Os02g0102950 [Oryza sativa Japonica Group]|uniref:Os02g0102950 protein n=1 Tax=Oryza sativa subsp. japonica TaxID=39947 RepID=A0A0P0VDN8_ORYSJ|nr:hypothetical protein EE612_008287 [Oryza sativa]BAS76533.1 Os02g0102950 [Oryza sativa Japonica Group]